MSRDKVLFTVLLIISILLFIGKPEQRIKKAQFLSKTIFLPYVNSIYNYMKISALQNENKQLQLKNASLMLDNLKFRDLYQKISGQPFTISESSENEQLRTVIADVIGYTGAYWERSLLINKGSRDGISQDDPVATSVGIVGKVVSVSQLQATILPLSNYRFQLPVKLKRNHVQGVIETDLMGKQYMNYIKIGSPINVADTVVVSNLSKKYPMYYPVGVVKKIADSKDKLYLSAEITPFNTIENLKSIYIFTNFKGTENEREEAHN
ncbi:MAG: rod shape-determining protein MreC [Candidatus Cloacimonetes bacterium]|nr:rod shape-determining protein MreC [Candidatus Cloacimonadota bacterium]